MPHARAFTRDFLSDALLDREEPKQTDLLADRLEELFFLWGEGAVPRLAVVCEWLLSYPQPRKHMLSIAGAAVAMAGADDTLLNTAHELCLSWIHSSSRRTAHGNSSFLELVWTVFVNRWAGDTAAPVSQIDAAAAPLFSKVQHSQHALFHCVAFEDRGQNDRAEHAYRELLERLDQEFAKPDCDQGVLYRNYCAVLGGLARVCETESRPAISQHILAAPTITAPLAALFARCYNGEPLREHLDVHLARLRADPIAHSSLRFVLDFWEANAFEAAHALTRAILFGAEYPDPAELWAALGRILDGSSAVFERLRRTYAWELLVDEYLVDASAPAPVAERALFATNLESGKWRASASLSLEPAV